MGNQKRLVFVLGPPNFTKHISFRSAFRATRFRLPVSGPLSNDNNMDFMDNPAVQI